MPGGSGSGGQGTRSTLSGAIGTGASHLDPGNRGTVVQSRRAEPVVRVAGGLGGLIQSARRIGQTTTYRRFSMRRLMMRRRDGRTATTPGAAHPRRRLRLPTSGAALAVSIVALVVAMAGSAYAGATLGKGSVGTKQLQKGAVTRRQDRQGRDHRRQAQGRADRPERAAREHRRLRDERHQRDQRDQRDQRNHRHQCDQRHQRHQRHERHQRHQRGQCDGAGEGDVRCRARSSPRRRQLQWAPTRRLPPDRCRARPAPRRSAEVSSRRKRAWR